MSWVTNNEWLQAKDHEEVNWPEMGRFLHWYRTDSYLLVAVGCVSILGSLTFLFVPKIFYLIEQALNQKKLMDSALLAGGYWGMLMIQSSSIYVSKVIQARISTRLNRKLALDYYEKVLNISVKDFLEFKNRTNVFQRLIDALAITPQVTEILSGAIQSITVLCITLYVIGRVNLQVAGVVCVGQVIIALFVYWRAPLSRKKRQVLLAVNYPLVSKMLEIIGGLLTIKTLTATVSVTSDIAGMVSRKCDAEFDESRCDVQTQQGIQLITNTTLLTVAIVAFAGALHGGIDAGQAVAVYVLTTFALSPAAELGRLYQALVSVSGNVKNYYQVLDLPNEASAVDEPSAHQTAIEVVRSGLRAERPAMSTQLSSGDREILGMQHMSRSENAFGIASAVCDHAPQISFDNISFAYPGKDFLIDHLTLSVAQGEKVCLVGRSGVGKTTMLRLLLSFLSPTHGCIRMDGVDINDFADKNAYRQYFGVVSQDDILFNISLRDNLVFGLSTEPHDEQIYDVLERVGLRDDVWKLPQRLETLYAEHSLSGGQKQRFVVARALLRKPRIILLDEPTSALDFENEDKVLMAIDHLVGTRTAISVAHRLSTVRAADRIAVLGEGRVVATGSHEELLETSVYYQRLCKFNSFIL